MLDPSLAAQLLIVALDSAPWPEYNCQAVLDHMAASTRRTPFRRPRSDSGGKHKRRRVRQEGSFSQPCPSAASSSSAVFRGQEVEDASDSSDQAWMNVRPHMVL